MGLQLSPVIAGGGGGSISGPNPATSTDNAVVRWDGAGGTTLQNSVVTMSDTGMMTWTAAGEALDATKYQFGRDDSATNQLKWNVPNGATMTWGIGGNVALVLNTSGTLLTNGINSHDALSSTLTLQNQTFTAGGTHNALALSPTWVAENQSHTAFRIGATQNGANNQVTTGLQVAMTKATAATTLANMHGISILFPTVAGTVTTSNAIQILDQTNANITTPRGINFGSTGVANSIVWGGSALQYANAAENIRFMDSTNARGIAFDLTAAGNQTISATGGTLTLTAPNIGVATGTSIALGGGTALANYVEGTFAPTVTLVGGVGNTTPVYSTNTGRYTRIGNRVFVDVLLSGDGGAEGAGTGTINVALPITASASSPIASRPCGTGLNNATTSILAGTIGASATTVSLTLVAAGAETNYTGADQNNATRTIRLAFVYEV